MNLKFGKVFTSKFVGTGPSSYKKRIYRAAVSQMLRNIDLRASRAGRSTPGKGVPEWLGYEVGSGAVGNSLCLQGIKLRPRSQ